jgi:hemoglobin
MTNDYMIDQILVDDVTRSSVQGRSLFERYGGRPTLEKVHRIFYEKLFQHQWLGPFFKDVNQQHIENQQTDFMSQLTGGPKVYSGRMPQHAHMHIFISEELFLTRASLLEESLIEAGVAEQERREWLRVDAAFKKVMVKQSPAECKQRYSDEPIFVIAKPDKPAA